MVITMIIKAELSPVTLIPNRIFREKRLSATIAMDNPKERATRSITFICLKKTSVQAKPGRKNTSINPSIALKMGKCPRKGRADPKNSLISNSQSTPYISSSPAFDGIST